MVYRNRKGHEREIESKRVREERDTEGVYLKRKCFQGVSQIVYLIRTSSQEASQHLLE